MTPQEHMAWAQAQMALAVPSLNLSIWQVSCPACGDVLYRVRSAGGLMAALERHLLSDPPFGLEHLQRRIGEQLQLGGERYEVAEVFRPYANRYYHKVRVHTFQLALRRLSDGRLFRTSATQPGVVEPLARSQRRAFRL